MLHRAANGLYEKLRMCHFLVSNKIRIDLMLKNHSANEDKIQSRELCVLFI